MSDAPATRRLAEWDDAALRELAQEHGTPLYVLDRDRVAENVRRLATAFPAARLLYAMKANALRDVLETVLEAGAGLECASAGELERAIGAGASGADVHYTAVNPPAADLDTVVEHWCEAPELTVTAGAADTIDRLSERGFDGRLCVRVSPGVGAGHHETVRTGADASFGVSVDRVVDVVADAVDAGLDVVGVHGHLGSGIGNDDLATHRAFLEELASVAARIERQVTALELVDVGGGFGVPYGPDVAPLDLEAVAETTRAALADLDVETVVEPGRYVVADAGVLLTSVTTVKRPSGPTIAGVDAGMTTLLRPALYGASHPVRSVAADASDRETTRVTVAGPVCESADVLATDRRLPAPRRGDLLAVGMAGAYGYEMASHYTSRPRPATVVVDGTGARLGRRRETVRDITRPERARPEVEG